MRMSRVECSEAEVSSALVSRILAEQEDKIAKHACRAAMNADFFFFMSYHFPSKVLLLSGLVSES
jgi:hypothetical protein